MKKGKSLPSTSNWRWKVQDPNPLGQPGLLYDPGNWGDLLKGVVLAQLVPALAQASQKKTFRVIDPFSGRPWYALTAAAARRCGEAAGGALGSRLERFLGRQILPSSGCLVLEIGRELVDRGAAPERLDLAVFDLDAEARREWSEVPGARVLKLSSGYDIWSLDETAEADFLLLDPYDFLDRWQEVLPRLLGDGRTPPFLVYLYNKSPRGEGIHRNYRAFRADLEMRLVAGSQTALLYRVPSDTILPRAFHEVLAGGPKAFLGGLKPALEREVERLAGLIWRPGIVEALGESRADYL